MALSNTQIEILRTVFETQGEQSLVDARDKLAGIGTQTDELRNQLNRGYLTQNQYNAAVKALGKEAKEAKASLGALEAIARESDVFRTGQQSLADLNREINKYKNLTPEARTAAIAQGREVAKLSGELKKLERQFGGVRSGSAGAGQALLQTGRVVQDFAQGGIGGILNNIEGFAASLGLGAGVAGALTAIGVAAVFVGPKLKELFDLFGDQTKVRDFRSEMDKVNDAISAINKKEIKLPVDVKSLEIANAALEKLQKAKAAFDALDQAKPKDVEKSGKNFTEALTDSGEKDKLIGKDGSARQAFVDREYRNDPALKEAEASLAAMRAKAKEILTKGMDVPLGLTNALIQAQKDLPNQRGLAMNNANAKFDAILGGAASGDVKAQKQAIEILKGGGASKDLTDKLSKTSPEAIAAEERAKALKHGMKVFTDALDEAAKGFKKEVDKKDKEIDKERQAGEAHKVDHNLKAEADAKKARQKAIDDNLAQLKRAFKAEDRAAGKDERDQLRDEKKQAREEDKAAKDAARIYGGGSKRQIEAAYAQANASGEPVDLEAMHAQAIQSAYESLQGAPLPEATKRNAAESIASDARDDVTKKLADLQGQGLDAISASQAVIGQILDEAQRTQQRLRALEQTNRRQSDAARGIRNNNRASNLR